MKLLTQLTDLLILPPKFNLVLTRQMQICNLIYRCDFLPISCFSWPGISQKHDASIDHTRCLHSIGECSADITDSAVKCWLFSLYSYMQTHKIFSTCIEVYLMLSTLVFNSFQIHSVITEILPYIVCMQWLLWVNRILCWYGSLPSYGCFSQLMAVSSGTIQGTHQMFLTWILWTCTKLWLSGFSLQ